MASDAPNVVVLGKDPRPLHEIIVIKGRDDALAHAGTAADELVHLKTNPVLRYWTDASRRGTAEKGPVGAAFCLRSLFAGGGWVDCGMKCHNLSTSAVGELHAIAMAMNHAVETLDKLDESARKEVRIELFSDSTHALQKITGDREIDSLDEVTIVRDILELLRFLPVEPGRVQMFWSPAHSGIAGNERADEKAGMASKQAKDLTNFPFVRSGLAPLDWSRAEVADSFQVMI
ncbi:hypothetical protein AG0111_0g2524 [Alternaria gaisen]|uniref:Uncharacterized protein n=1 Tax=Alternaria gaisen TaxID=167740 RepID=A0ACB6FVI1_9PLEO|nr:hypothetical protein AG0111_0g2524 [Alternaria gaisen]